MMQKNHRDIVEVVLPSHSDLRIEGVVIGTVALVEQAGSVHVQFPGNPAGSPILAQAVVLITSGDVGREVALVFQQGHPMQPVIMGFLHHPQQTEVELLERMLEKEKKDLDGETLTFSANREIVFRCGDASITLTRAGKILLRGKYLLSRSSGVNRIKGGSVQIN